MVKAYDLADLAAKAKAQGLPLAEEGCARMLKCIDAWLIESAALSENKIDDLDIPLIPYLEKLALGYLDKVDGKDDARA